MTGAIKNLNDSGSGECVNSSRCHVCRLMGTSLILNFGSRLRSPHSIMPPRTRRSAAVAAAALVADMQMDSDVEEEEEQVDVEMEDEVDDAEEDEEEEEADVEDSQSVSSYFLRQAF